MLLERTIAQLDLGQIPDDQAERLGHLGYMQWLGALPGKAGYLQEAARAYQMAQPFIQTSPAVAVFCGLLVESVASPLTPLTLHLPQRRRRGGAKARRSGI